MASSFKARDDECESCHEEDAVVTYRVDEKQKLCNRCSVIKQDAIKTPRATSVFICVKHQEEGARLFCETHRNVICTACAATDTHKSCSIKDVQDAVDARKDKLTDLIQQGNAKSDEIKDREYYVTERAKRVFTRLLELETEVKASFVEKTKTVINRSERNVTKINQEEDDKIAKINERRNADLKSLQQKVDEELKNVDTNKETILTSIMMATDVTEKILRETKTSLDSYLANLAEKMDITSNLISNENDLLSEARDVTRSMHECLGTKFSTEKIDKVSSMVDRVSFLKVPGDVRGAVAVGECMLEQEEELPLGLSNPTMLGTSNKDEVVFTNKTGSVHVKNVNNKTARKVLKGRNQISTCASLNDRTGRIVCGTDTAQVLIYNKKWELIRTVNLASKGNNLTLVCAYKESFVLSAISGETTICVLSPDDGRLVKVIPTKEKPVFGLHSLPSSYIAIVTECSKGKDICIWDESGNVKTTVHFHDAKELSITSDIISDSYYIVSRGRCRRTCTLTIMGSSGVVIAKTTFMLPYRTLQDLNCTISASGKLVMNTSETVLVYNIKVRSLSEMTKHSW